MQNAFANDGFFFSVPKSNAPAKTLTENHNFDVTLLAFTIFVN